MSEPSTTTVTRTATLAVLAVAQHAADYRLGFSGIDIPIAGDPATVRVRAVDLDDWLETVIVTDDPIVRSCTSPENVGHETVQYRGRITTAIGDMAVIVWTVRTVAPLHLVGSAS